MPAKKDNNIYSNLTYTSILKDSIIKSGGTVVFIRDNLMLATEVSEAQYRELLNSPYIDKIDVLPIKRYGNDIVQYEEVVTNEPMISVDSVVVTTKTTQSSTKTTATASDTTKSGSGGGCPTLDMKIKISEKRNILVDDLKDGQYIYTMHEKTKEFGYFKIKKLEKTMEQIVKVSFGYDFVTVSNSHKFLTDNDIYVSISELYVGSKVKTISDYITITDIEEIGFGTVMIIEVEDAHTYIINDMISHNKQIRTDE